MERLDIQVMMKDGSFKDFEALNERGSNVFDVQDKGKSLAVFEADANGSWNVSDNAGNIDDDLQQRIINQLNGFLR